MIDGNGNETRTIYEAHLLEENCRLQAENEALKAENETLKELSIIKALSEVCSNIVIS